MTTKLMIFLVPQKSLTLIKLKQLCKQHIAPLITGYSFKRLLWKQLGYATMNHIEAHTILENLKQLYSSFPYLYITVLITL